MSWKTAEEERRKRKKEQEEAEEERQQSAASKTSTTTTTTQASNRGKNKTQKDQAIRTNNGQQQATWQRNTSQQNSRYTGNVEQDRATYLLSNEGAGYTGDPSYDRQLASWKAANNTVDRKGAMAYNQNLWDTEYSAMQQRQANMDDEQRLLDSRNFYWVMEQAGREAGDPDLMTKGKEGMAKINEQLAAYDQTRAQNLQKQRRDDALGSISKLGIGYNPNAKRDLHMMDGSPVLTDSYAGPWIVAADNKSTARELESWKRMYDNAVEAGDGQRAMYAAAMYQATAGDYNNRVNNAVGRYDSDEGSPYDRYHRAAEGYQVAAMTGNDKAAQKYANKADKAASEEYEARKQIRYQSMKDENPSAYYALTMDGSQLDAAIREAEANKKQHDEIVRNIELEEPTEIGRGSVEAHDKWEAKYYAAQEKQIAAENELATLNAAKSTQKEWRDAEFVADADAMKDSADFEDKVKRGHELALQMYGSQDVIDNYLENSGIGFYKHRNSWEDMTNDEEAIFYALFADDPTNYMPHRYVELKRKEKNDEHYAAKAERVRSGSALRRIGAFAEVALENIMGGAVGIVENTMNNPLRGINTVGAVKNLFGGGGRQAERFSRSSAALRQGLEQGIKEDYNVTINGKKLPVGDALAFVVGTGESMLESGSAAALAKGLAASGHPVAAVITQVVSTAIMGSSAATSDYIEMKDAGWSEEEARAHAACAGLWEFGFEYVSLDHLVDLDETVGLAKNILVQANIEASEELATNLAGTISDAALAEMYGKSNKIERDQQQYIQQGYSPDEAYSKAINNWGTEILYDWLGGLFSGGMMSYLGSNGLSRTYESARNAAAKTRQAVGRYAGTQIDAMRYDLVGSNRLAGLDSAAVDPNVQRIITEQVSGKTVQEQQKVLDQVVQRYGDETAKVVYDAVALDTAKQASKLESTDAILQAREQATAQIQDESMKEAVQSGYDYAAVIKSMESNDENDLARYRQQTQNKGRGSMTMEATVTNQDGQSRQVAITGMSEDGKSVVLSDGVKIAVKNLQADADTMDVVQRLSKMDLGSDATKVLEAYQERELDGTDGYRWLMDYTTAYQQGRTNVISLEDAAKRSSLDQQTVMDAYELGQKSAYQDTQKAMDRLAAMPKKAGITGHTSNIDVSEIKGKTLNASEQEQFELANQIMSLVGVNVKWFSSKTKDGRYVGKNGAYENGTVYMDIHAGRNFVSQLNSGILQTTNHELTHFLQQYAPQQYKNLKDYLFRQIGNTKGGEQTLERLIWEKQRRAEGKLSRQAAEDEVVADACQKMLQDSKALREFAEEHKEAAKGIVRWLDKWFQKLKKAFGKSARLSEEARFVDSMEENVRKAFGDLWDEALREAVATHDRVGNIGEAVVKDASTLGASDQMVEDAMVQHSDRIDEETLKFLDEQEHVTVYRAMQEIDGKLYPPMAAKVEGKLVEPTEIGKWYQSVERPDLVKNGKFTLNKGNGTSVPAAYNPYFHCSASPLNDQFSSAYKRPNLVVVEGIIPKSELTSGYRAEGAKNSVGETTWHAGPVASKLKGDKARRVFLSRWFQVQRIMTDAEVAGIVAKTLEGENVSVPSNVVTPGLLEALRNEGVQIDETGIQRQSRKNTAQNSDREYMELAKDPKKNEAKLQEMVDEAAKVEQYKVEHPERQYSERDYSQKSDYEILRDLDPMTAASNAELRKNLELTQKRLAKVQSQQYELNSLRKQIAAATGEKRAALEAKAKSLQGKISGNVKEIDKSLNTSSMQNLLKAQRAAAREKASQQFMERRDKKNIRDRIKNLHAEMTRDLLKPREEHYVPQQFVRSVTELLEMVNTQTNREKSESAQAKIDAINRAYDKLKKDERYSQFYDETVKAMLVELSETVAGRSIYNLSADELSDVYTVMKAMRTTIRNAIRADLIEKGKMAWEAGNELRQELRNGKGAAPYLLEKYLTAMLSAKRAFNRFGGYMQDSTWNKVYRMLDDAQMKQLTLEMKATRIFDSVLKEKADLKQAEALTSYKDDDLVDVGLKDADGNAVKITRGMMLSLYMHLQNEENMRHLMYGGMTLPDFRRYYKGKAEAWGQGTVEIPALGAKVANLDELFDELGEEGVNEKYNEYVQEIREMYESVRSAIEEELTDYDRKWIAASKEFFDKFSRRELNKVTNEMYGFSKAKVENYFPIVTDTGFLKSEFESISRDISLENAGFMKERVKASNPILLEDITRAVNRQINNVSRYAGLTQALKTFGMVYNAQTKGFTDSVKKAMAKTYGQNGMKYIENLITDMIGGRSTESSIFDKIKGNYAQAVLAANLSVTIKQAASFPTAAATVGWKPLMKALAKGGQKGLPISRADRALIDTYTALMFKRAQGAVDTEIGDMAHARDWTKKAQWLMGWIQKTDLATVGRLWYAAEYYVKDNFKGLEVGTEEQIKNGDSPFYQKVSEVFRDIVEDTQPNYTVLQRPDILRNPNKLVRALTMFSTQRFQNANILIDAVNEYAAMVRYDKQNSTTETKAARKAAKQKLTRAITSQVVSAVVLNVMTLFAGAVLHRMNPWRDDDDELTVASIAEEFLNGFMSTMSGSFLGGSELYEAVSSILTGSKYYGNDVGGISTANELAKSVVNFGQEAVKIIGNENSTADDWKKLAEKQVSKVGEYLAQMTGVPVSNVNKIIAGAKNHMIDAMNDELFSFEAGVERTNKVNAHRFYEAWKDNDRQKMNRILDEVKNSGSSAQSIENAFNKQAKEAYESGEIDIDQYYKFLYRTGLWDDEKIEGKVIDILRDEYKAGLRSDEETEQLLIKYNSKVENKDDAWKVMQRWGAAVEHAGEEGYNYSEYEAFYDSLDEGKSFDEAAAEYLDHGYKEENLRKNAVDHLREQYKAGELTEDKAIEKYMDVSGKDENDAWKAVQKWGAEAEHADDEDYSYSLYDDLRDAVSSGKGIDTAVNVLTDHGITEETVSSEISKAIRSSFTSGDIDEDTAIDYLVKYRGMDENKAWSTVQKWSAEAEHANEEDYSYSKYEDIDATIDKNGDIKTLVKELTDHGTKEEDVKSHVKSYLVDKFVQGKSSEAALKNQLSRYCGIVNKDDVDKILRDANCKKQFGVNYSGLDEEYRAGNVSRSDMKTALTKYGGLSSADADKKIRWYDLQKANPNLSITESQSNNWHDGTSKSRENGHESAKAAGMSIEAYLKAKEILDEIKDSNGNNTGEDEYIAALSRMSNLTARQKDALYYEKYKGTTKYSKKTW